MLVKYFIVTNTENAIEKKRRRKEKEEGRKRKEQKEEKGTEKRKKFALAAICFKVSEEAERKEINSRVIGKPFHSNIINVNSIFGLFDVYVIFP